MSDIAETTVPSGVERAPNGQFQLGHSGKGGRPRGSRARLGEEFLEVLARDWHEHGAQAIIDARQQSPVDYVKVISKLLPSQVELSVTGEFARLESIDDVVALLLADSDPSALLELLDTVRARVIDLLAERALPAPVACG
jgi:hypothetical protein